MLTHRFFKQMLAEATPERVRPNSVLNHHVNGMNYLCLHRSPELTVKLYLVERPVNHHSGFLVHPHSHRYAFGSIVLAGDLNHLRFAEDSGDKWNKWRYNPDTKGLNDAGKCGLRQISDELIFSDGEFGANSYWVDPHEVHTLRMLEQSGPLLIGLVQHSDITVESDLYLPTDETMLRSDSRQMTLRETATLMARAMQLIEGRTC